MWADVLFKNTRFYHIADTDAQHAEAKKLKMNYFHGAWSFTDIDKSLKSNLPYTGANPPEAENIRKALVGKKYHYKIVSVDSDSPNKIFRELPSKYATFIEAKALLPSLTTHLARNSEDLKPLLRIKIEIE